MSKFFSSVLLISIVLFVAHAAPASAAAGGFLSQSRCDESTFQFYDVIELGPAPEYKITVTPNLSGLCPGSSGQMTNSTLNLNTCLANNDAHLLWQKKYTNSPLPSFLLTYLRSGMFQSSCGCTLQMPNLCCGCSKSNGETVDSGICIDLNQGVAAAAGKLNCNTLPSNG
ncbi:predicted protein [Sclerotinia sclerotiorum 1980 UF-70]|uniref:Cyanovirin-N domain-containing protein n=2 Tax=Sclerotinia sclerotiorum (strain ATCC 18683 / 1980 / Ss-1) TaxID=665079 RepID=A7EC66_SCLS1|nr:predicted protein [Sclerotinia sclerotiorum 1980 UF-70]APA09032.1 hypothetical protein sscle_04g038020 [Sclerotinia sclerotiorum 1980 UF-70]EDO00045.1 predicted protein [Sclerotinia sclerotiorum 1980 UF-70]